jgi:hypothetical protein
VLDDDAVDCPFCGAPMKGGPGKLTTAKPKTATAPQPGASKAASTKTTPGTSTATSVSAVKAALAGDKPTKPPPKGAPKDSEKEAPPAEDDDPFAVDQSVAAGAVPVSRQQGPGKTLEVKCPMCETKGFISPKAAGKLVKCCNPQCLVPIFTAPAIEKKQPVAPPPKPKSKIPWLYVVGGIVVAGIAGACIWIMNQEGPREIAPVDVKKVIRGPGIGENPDEQEVAPKKIGEKVDAPGENPAAAARKRLIDEVQDRLTEIALHAENNRKAQCWRLGATAYIYEGDFKQAASQLDLIEKSRNSQYEAVLPLAALAWKKATSAPEEFSKTVDRTKRLADKLPSRGRYATEAAIDTAALLAASGKADDARAIVAKHHADPAIDQLAAALRIVTNDQTYNLDRVFPGRSIDNWQAPLETAVILILANHGRWDDAFAFANGVADDVAKAEASTAWAEVFARKAVPAEDAAGFEHAQKAAEGLGADGKARLLARLAAVKVSAGDNSGAEELIAESQAALDTIPRPPAVKLQGAKSVLDLPLKKPIPLRQAALAATEIAGVQVQLANRDAAWNNILLALKFLHAIAPSTSAVRERRLQFDKEPQRIRDELKKAMAIKKEDEVRRTFTQYRQKLEDIEKASDFLFFWEQVILSAAADFGLHDRVWEELQALDRKPVPEREPLLSTAGPLVVAARYRAAGNARKAADIIETVESKTSASDPLVVKQVSEQLFSAGDYAGCAEQLNEAMTATGILHECALRLACRLVTAGKFAEAVGFCNGFKIQALKEDGLFLIAAQAARDGHAGEFWEAASGLGRMDAANVSAGLLVGLHSEPAEK